MTATTVRSFDLNLEEIEVSFKQKGSEVPLECVIREMTGFARDMFMNAQKRRANFRTKEVTDFKDVQTELISCCLFYKSDPEKKVESTVIREFPARVMGDVYKICVELNGLNEEAEKEVKND